MSKAIKKQSEILAKLGIEMLNEMQEQAKLAIHSSPEVVLLSPTGTGKTLAFLLPIIAEIDPELHEVQVLIITPSRELTIQIEQVTRDIGSGYKTNAVYGGQTFSKDRVNLKHTPYILIGTPGRVADHLRRGTVDGSHISTLVLDEFDKSLEIGFEEEMSEIMKELPFVKKKILTSATKGVEIPAFVKLKDPTTIDFLHEKIDQLEIRSIISPEKDKIFTLIEAIAHLGDQPGIIFCNFKDSIARVSSFLSEKNIEHGTFFGGMEQLERERALIKFRNGTHKLLIATDLAARGIDVPEIKFIVHYHLPLRAEEFTHRNGRTARMKSDGRAYVLHWKEEELPEFIGHLEEEKLEAAPFPKPSGWTTLIISGGRKDKISKGDIAGLMFKQGNLKKDDVGLIELKQDCAFAAVKSNQVDTLIPRIDNSRLKKKKVRVREI